MKDLANLYYFEKLLEDVNNDLVRQAQAKGDIAIGAVCFQIPEPLINLPGSFSVRLRCTQYRFYRDGYILHEQYAM